MPKFFNISRTLVYFRLTFFTIFLDYFLRELLLEIFHVTADIWEFFFSKNVPEFHFCRGSVLRTFNMHLNRVEEIVLKAILKLFFIICFSRFHSSGFGRWFNFFLEVDAWVLCVIDFGDVFKRLFFRTFRSEKMLVLQECFI